MSTVFPRRRRLLLDLAAAVITVLMASPASVAQELDETALIDALRDGGLVIVMRHASSPRAEPSGASAAPGNVNRERQLDELGLQTARAMGDALRQIGVPIGEILSSPTFRALQTAELLELGAAQPADELGDGGQDMRQNSAGLRSEWLRSKASEAPAAGTNRLIITHSPNVLGAFGEAASGIAQGESLIIRPDNGEARVVGRVAIAQWPRLAAP